MTACSSACGWCGACSRKSDRHLSTRGFGTAVRINGRLIGAVGYHAGGWWASLVRGEVVKGFASKPEAMQWVKARAEVSSSWVAAVGNHSS